MSEDSCSIPVRGHPCNAPSVVGYYGYGVCQFHWDRECDSNDRFNLKDALGIKRSAAEIECREKYKRLQAEELAAEMQARAVARATSLKKVAAALKKRAGRAKPKEEAPRQLRRKPGWE